jgi:hypothetical protein
MRLTYLNTAAVPLHHIDATPAIVEARACGAFTRTSDSASSVLRRTGLAICVLVVCKARRMNQKRLLRSTETYERGAAEETGIGRVAP